MLNTLTSFKLQSIVGYYLIPPWLATKVLPKNDKNSLSCQDMHCFSQITLTKDLFGKGKWKNETGF